MSDPVVLVDVLRGGFVECQHRGHWVLVNEGGDVVDGAGDPDLALLPRSSLKPVQAYPLIESGAADAFHLTNRHIALACASHQGAPIHTDLASAWLTEIGRQESDLRCGVQPPATSSDRQALRDANRRADQTHNNCSGKHTGFLTVARHVDAGPEYLDPDHPVQLMVRDVVADLTGIEPPGFAIDGCSAPNFQTTLKGLARAMAGIATAREGAGDRRSDAAVRIRQAMMAHPELVAGEGRVCTRLMRILGAAGVVKTGAEGVFAAALPELGLGFALKIADGATRASEVATVKVLADLGLLDRDHPEVRDMMFPVVRNWRKTVTGNLRPTPE